MYAFLLRVLYSLFQIVPEAVSSFLFRFFWSLYWWRERRTELAFAPDPPEEPVKGSERAVFIEEIVGKEPPGNILEIGFGYGQNIGILKELLPGVSYTGVEIDFERVFAVDVQYRADAVKTINLLNADILSLPFSDESFDTVIVAAVLLYFPGDTLKGVLLELFRVARRRIILLEQNTTGLDERIERYDNRAGEYYLRDYCLIAEELFPENQIKKNPVKNKRWISEKWREYAEVIVISK